MNNSIRFRVAQWCSLIAICWYSIMRYNDELDRFKIAIYLIVLSIMTIIMLVPDRRKTK
jgi:succinate-acetate transporter protein